MSYRLGLGLERNKRKVLKSGMLPSAVKSRWSCIAPVAMAVHWKRARIDQLTGKRPPVVLGSPVSIHPIGSHFNFGVRHVLHHVRWALTWFVRSQISSSGLTWAVGHQIFCTHAGMLDYFSCVCPRRWWDPNIVYSESSIFQPHKH